MNRGDTMPREAKREATKAEAELLPGHFPALLRQLGWLKFPAPSAIPLLPSGGIRNVRQLRQFLERYHAQIIAPLELPVIARAYQFAARGQLRELLALDGEIARVSLPPFLAAASRRVGRSQLESLRPLREERTAQRYLAAVESGQALGWHTVVHGLTLAIYSWPLRTGLMSYAQETLSGLGQAAGRSAGLPHKVCRQTVHSLLHLIPASIEEALASGGERRLLAS